MRWILVLIAMAMLWGPATARAEEGDQGVVHHVEDKFGRRVAVLSVGECNVIFMHSVFRDYDEEYSKWSGACSNGLANGPGVLLICMDPNDPDNHDCREYQGAMAGGLLNGPVQQKAYNRGRSGPYQIFEGIYIDGCKTGSVLECDVDLFRKLRAQYGGPGSNTDHLVAKGGAETDASEGVQSSSGEIGAETGGGFIYDDDDHGKCVSVKPVSAQGSGSKMAYGRYILVNSCSYPIKLLTCINPDGADSDGNTNYDKHRAGQPCPGMGWLGTTLDTGEQREDRSWFEYNRLRWEISACRAGWDFVGPDGMAFPDKALGRKYRCRKSR